MEQNQKTLVRLSKQNKTREEHKKVSICSAKKGKHTCRVRIVQNGVFVIVMIRCGFLFWREQSNLIDKGQIWSSCLQIHQPYTECTESKARSCHISSVADTQDLKGYRYSCGAVIIAADLPVCLTASFAFVTGATCVVNYVSYHKTKLLMQRSVQPKLYKKKVLPSVRINVSNSKHCCYLHRVSIWRTLVVGIRFYESFHYHRSFCY